MYSGLKRLKNTVLKILDISIPRWRFLKTSDLRDHTLASLFSPNKGVPFDLPADTIPTPLINVRAITFCHSLSTLYGFSSSRHGNTGHQAWT